ncbi:hypothetical protein F751_1572 [Auxenochlorella protothecoides]|uniref:Uncharacterized protein n=1 Tax=Auxenochlorella protothecoides TaxID=3075 RepID=A0A087SRD9_AUXPR|nr:hypothetical protein F751_1572 [Auxenochlorella protothecoides]KFM28293.1 hypothetical protein F751_1572 [Auxenochlorella protothecoides]
MATTPQAKTLTRLIQPSLSWLRTSTYVPVDLRRSMSGGASDSDGKKAASASDGDRPLSNSPSVKATRLASASSLSEPSYLGNSMSGAGPPAACMLSPLRQGCPGGSLLPTPPPPTLSNPLAPLQMGCTNHDAARSTYRTTRCPTPWTPSSRYLGLRLGHACHAHAARGTRLTVASPSPLRPCPPPPQNSLAGESNYHLPAALQNRRGGIPKAQGFSTGKARPTLQRIVVRTSIHDAEPLGNSYSDAEYVPRRR